VLAGHYEIVLDLDGSMSSTRVPNCWGLLANIPGFYVRRQNLTVLNRTPCGPVMDGLRYHPNRPVPVNPGSFVLAEDGFAAVRLAVLAVTLNGPPVSGRLPRVRQWDY